MSGHGMVMLGLLVGVVTLAAWPIGIAIARILEAKPTRIERALYRICRVDPDEEMTWRSYAGALLAFNAVGFAAVLGLERLQGVLPLDPLACPAVPWGIAVNTAVSFVTNTNWQAYGGETTMSLLTQSAGLAVQNFLSAATGIAVLAAVARGFRRKETAGLGSFWVDVTRATLVLVAASLVLATALVSQGVVQTTRGSVPVDGLAPGSAQTIPLGPVASQVAIKQLGTNGGGFYNANSAHPLENPTPAAGAMELCAILLIPAALCLTFGAMAGDRRQGIALLLAMTVIFVPLAAATIATEEHAGSLEGKETRFGVAESALWAAATTAASNGSVNAMHDSFAPLGGLAPLVLMQLGEVVYGGVGSGVYGMVVFALVTVFLAGLMVGRTPEYLGKKIEAFEVQMAAIAVLLPSAAVLLGTAVACAIPAGRAAAPNPGPHGFTEMLYAFSSAANNNGSAFGGLDATGPLYTLGLALAMVVGRYGVILPVIAIAGSLAAKKKIPESAGTLPTHTPLFVALLVGVVLLMGALTFVPALALGPIAEQLR